MAIITAPNVIEQSDFLTDGGWAPDAQPGHTFPSHLLDVSNLLPDVATGALETRKGFYRVVEEFTSETDRYVLNLYPMNQTDGPWLIAVTTDGSAAADNVQLWAIDMGAVTAARIDTPGRQWANPTEYHWGMAVDGVWYGGVRGEPMYSWDPSTSTWDADAATPAIDSPVVQDAVNDNINDASELGRDYAYRGNEVVSFETLGAPYYRVQRNIRYEKWQDEEQYGRGDKVSRKTVWDSTSSYWKSFRCIKAHESVTADNAPGTGTDWKDYWVKVRLPLPEDDDGNTNTSAWEKVLTPPETSIGAWFGFRMWLRGDGYGDRSRLMFSAPLKLEQGEDINETFFDPTDWTPGTDLTGPGGGWIPVGEGHHGGPITALHAFGNYLLVFKRHSVWVVTGSPSNAATATVRKVPGESAGCPWQQAIIEKEGLVWYLSDDGLYLTDGTSIETAPGMEKVRDTYRARVDAMQAAGIAPELERWGPFVVISLPLADDHQTWWYHPETHTWWKTTLPARTMCRLFYTGVERLFFASQLSYGADKAIVYQYDHTSATSGGLNIDDTGAATVATQNIPWLVRTAWWPFGTLRQQRRIRRTWALVKAAASTVFTLIQYKDYKETVQATNTRTVSVATDAHIEGSWIPDSHAISLKLSGTTAPAVVHGMAVDTQPRRERYHTGGDSS